MASRTVYMLERVKFLTQRIKKIALAGNFNILETDNEHAFLESINNGKYNFSLILMDLDLSQKHSIELLAETRSRARNIPIIVMSAEAKKTEFIEAKLRGATDFIIKPFDDRFFLEKIQKCLAQPDAVCSEKISIDLNRYIKGELKKAEKGNFPLTMLFVYLENIGEDKLREHETNTYIFNCLKKQFWDTDLFVRFASEHCLGIFPFCGNSSTVILQTKIELHFQELKENNDILKDYNLMCAYITYPYDTPDKDQVFSLFVGRINAKFKDLRLRMPEMA